MNQGIESRAESVGGEYSDLDQAPGGQPRTQPTPAEQPPGQVATNDLQAERAAPDPVPEEDLSLEADLEQQRQRIEESGMNTEPAQLVEDGSVWRASSRPGSGRSSTGWATSSTVSPRIR